MKELKIVTKRGTLLDGMLFGTEVKADTVLICITGIHGNFYKYLLSNARPSMYL